MSLALTAGACKVVVLVVNTCSYGHLTFLPAACLGNCDHLIPSMCDQQIVALRNAMNSCVLAMKGFMVIV
jgi:hypothetical protein